MTPRPRANPTISRLATLLLAMSLATSGLLAMAPFTVVANSTEADPSVASPTALSAVLGQPSKADPEPQTPRLRPRPKPGRFSMNLYRKGDFVHQQTIHWCVAASVQTMLNIMEDGKPDRSRRSQRRIQLTARSLDPGHAWYWQQLPDGSPMKRGLHGLGLVHWADMLNAAGYGPYEIVRAETHKKAMRMAAKAMRTTRRPVGLVVWKGAHAWVMSGFKATADPAYTNRFKVKKVFVSDPWYPDVSSIWGSSRPPNSKVPVSALGQDYLPYDRPGRKHPDRDGGYMLILPTLPILPAVTSAMDSPSQGPSVDVEAAVDVADLAGDE